MDLKDAFGALAIATSFIGILPYVISFYKGQTKPHAYSWLAWAGLGFIQYMGMVNNHAGAGSWIHLSSCILYLLIGLAALKWGDRERKLADYVALTFCLGAGLIVIFLENYLMALLLAIFADMLAYVPTWRKIWKRPHEEDASIYWLGALMYVFSSLAIGNPNSATLVTPLSLLLFSGGTGVVIAFRRRTIKTFT